MPNIVWNVTIQVRNTEEGATLDEDLGEVMSKMIEQNPKATGRVVDDDYLEFLVPTEADGQEEATKAAQKLVEGTLPKVGQKKDSFQVVLATAQEA